MYREKIHPRQMSAWLFTAMSAPILTMAGKSGWLETATAALILGGLSWYSFWVQQRSDAKPGTVIGVMQILWICVILGQIGRWTIGIWPAAAHQKLVPMMLLLLAAISASGGVSASARCSSTLWWLVMLIYIAICISGLKDITGQWLRPTWQEVRPEILLVMLLPAAAGFLKTERNGVTKRAYLWVAIFAVGAAIWTIGSLSSRVAKNIAWPFYETCKGLNLYGIAERFEVFASAAVSIGYYSLCNLLLSVCGSIGEGSLSGRGKGSIIIAWAISCVFVLIIPEYKGLSAVLGTAVLWIIVPIISTVKRNRNNLKKYEKSA